MRLAILIRLAIPLLLALASATFFFRALILLVLAVTFAGLMLLLFRLTVKIAGKTGQTTKEGKKFVEGSYKIIDDNEKQSK